MPNPEFTLQASKLALGTPFLCLYLAGIRGGLPQSPVFYVGARHPNSFMFVWEILSPHEEALHPNLSDLENQKNLRFNVIFDFNL